MAHDLFLGKTNRDWSLDTSQGMSFIPTSKFPSISESLLFNKWTAALALGGAAGATILLAAVAGKK